MNAVTVSNASIRYSENDDWTLKDVSFNVRQGETLLLLGHSGSGKSSLALALAGLIPRSIDAEMTGEIRVGGVDLATLPPGEACQSIGIVFQDPDTQFCMLTVEDEVAFGLENANVPREAMDRRIADSLAAVGLQRARHARIDRLSGGMKQALALACALAIDPPVLVLDEPTANLDPRATDAFFRLLRRLATVKKRAFIVIEHKLEAIAAFADRTLLLEEGRVKLLGPTRKVFAEVGSGLKAAGVWQPFASELAVERAEQGFPPLDPHPLSMDELEEAANRDRDLRDWLRARLRKRTPARTVPADLVNHPKPALAFSNVTFAYPHGDPRRPAVRDVTWSVPPGLLVALIGPNGSGKSTLAHLAFGLRRPNRGSVEIAGRPVSRMSRREIARRAGLVFQNPEHQFVTDTVFDEIAYTLRLSMSDEEAVRDRVWELLDRFSLAHRARAHPFSLSQGEKRRLSVAAVIPSEQSLLILDEPTFGQDAKSAYQLMETLTRFCDEGRTVVMITHDARLVWEFADAAAVMRAGSIERWGIVQGEEETGCFNFTRAIQPCTA